MIIAKEIDVCDWLRRLRLAMPSTIGYAVCVKRDKPECTKPLQEMCVSSLRWGRKVTCALAVADVSCILDAPSLSVPLRIVSCDVTTLCKFV